MPPDALRPRTRVRHSRRVFDLWLPLLCWLSLPVAADDSAGILPLLAGPAPQVVVAHTRLWSTPVLRQLYAGATPRWTPDQIAVLRASVAQIADEGLNPADCLAGELATLDRLPVAARELIATEALARLAFTLHFGKANPLALEPDWNYSRSFGAVDPVQWLRTAIGAADLGARLQSLRPTGPYYQALRTALAAYRARAADGGWPILPTGATLKPGMPDARVPVLRARLGQPPVMPGAAGDALRYDDTLVAAVRDFQRDHGLDVDGAVGRATLAALNVPLGARIDQIRINLERLRWVFRDRAPEFVAVNIAGFQAAYFLDGELRWQGRAIVGRPYRQTPIFRDELSYLELNPTWTVPPTILRKDFLPALRRNPAFLRQKKLRVVDPNGGPVDAATIDWRRVTASNFPYTLRQDPGADNALGRIKFMFPNPHAVYLHDTPSRALFARPERSFSSGCIRIEKPLELAEQLLHAPAKWNLASLTAALDGARTQRVTLPHKVPIMLLYLTVFPDADGRLQFRRDIYGRDPPLLAALDGPLVWAPPDDFRPSGSAPNPVGTAP